MHDDAPVAPPRRSHVRTLRTAVVVAVAAGGALAVHGGPKDAQGEAIEVLHAAPTQGADYDGDGLTDDQELVLGTFPYIADSDEDGFGDGEEIARQSDPLDLFSVPTTSGISASLTARGGPSSLQIVMCIHEPAGELYESIVRLGALRNGQVVSVPMARLMAFADIFETVGSDGSRIVTVEIPVHPAFVHTAGQATFFLAAGNSNTFSFGSAAKVDVTSTDNILLLQRATATHSHIQASQGGGSIRQPIPSGAGPSIPGTWVPGAICFQRSTVVGASGPVVLHQVIEADCVQGWDTYCASDCRDKVGTTYETIDPAALIGG